MPQCVKFLQVGGGGGVTDSAAHRRINFTEGKSNMVYGPDIISFPQTHL